MMLFRILYPNIKYSQAISCYTVVVVQVLSLFHMKTVKLVSLPSGPLISLSYCPHIPSNINSLNFDLTVSKSCQFSCKKVAAHEPQAE